ncbi:MAG TPA: hypothetical protein VE011_04645 [Candidatus Dormibacteraeota bacterium]|nr:hypothetical protein [Candidatus Dormibacteraeota bacterium]
MTRANRLSVSILSAILAAPAGLFFLAAIGRTLQPTAHEPSRTLDAVVTWFLALGGLGLFALLVVLPFVAVLLAGRIVWREWSTDSTLRSDLDALRRAAVPIVHRPAVILAVVVVAFGAVYFAAMLVHALAG